MHATRVVRRAESSKTHARLDAAADGARGARRHPHGTEQTADDQPAALVLSPVPLRAVPSAVAPRDGPGQDRWLRDEVIKQHLPLATSLARRYRGYGVPAEDLVQVARLGLVKAVDGFDASRGVNLSAYAVPTILGELRRYFRDKSWHLRLPRRLQELMLQINRDTDGLTQALRRTPTPADLAVRLHTTEADVRAALWAGNAYRPLSTSERLATGGSFDIADVLGDNDRSLDEVEDRERLRPLLAELPPQERRIVFRRYFGDMTQDQIGAAESISQTHVSRLLAKSLAHLHDLLLAER